jgi:hypothetical protein
MSTLWTFGDSYTFGHGCRPDGPTSEYYFNYKKEGDSIWSDLLGKMMNMDVNNFGKSGASNDFIIDSIIDNWDNFNEGDYAIIGITWHSRFDIPLNNELVWSSISKGFEEFSAFNSFEKEQIETIINFNYHFTDNKLYKLRHLKRFNFLDKLLKEKKVKTFLWEVYLYARTSRFEKIAEATDGEIKDYHFSFEGHKRFANMLYKKIINPTLL